MGHCVKCSESAGERDVRRSISNRDPGRSEGGKSNYQLNFSDFPLPKKISSVCTLNRTSSRGP